MLTLGENVFKHRSAALAAVLLLSPQRQCSSVKGFVPTGRQLEGMASPAKGVETILPRSKPTQTLWVQMSSHSVKYCSGCAYFASESQ